MQLTVLGTSAPFPVPGNACSGYLVRSGDVEGQVPDARPTSLWIDAGTGTLAELQRHVSLAEVDGIFISHRHADHTADLLVAYYALKYGSGSAQEGAMATDGNTDEAGDARTADSQETGGRRVPVFGPEGLAERLAEFLGPDSFAGLTSVFEFTPMHGWGEARVDGLSLEWGPVSHGVPAFGVTVRDGAPGRSGFTYSGDTAPCISLVELAEESATLLCEVGYSAVPSDERVHCTPEDAGRMAKDAEVSTLVLTHLRTGLDPAEAAARAAAVFAGEVRVAAPGATFTV